MYNYLFIIDCCDTACISDAVKLIKIYLMLPLGVEGSKENIYLIGYNFSNQFYKLFK